MLAFARRNVKIDRVFEAAQQRGLDWQVVDDYAEGVSGVEPIYLFSWQQLG